MLAIKYAVFAIISTGFNLLFQAVSFLCYEGKGSLYIAMIIGTFSGLVIKYILDKKFIFYHQVKNKKDDAKTFFFYLLMGIFTTIIFWGTEIAFDTVLDHPEAKYMGAVIGLSIGYVMKYFLDKKFVFVK